MNKGRYDYPMYDSAFDSDVIRKDGYIHRINKVTDQNTVVISRPERTIFPYIVSLSYLVLFFSFFFLLLLAAALFFAAESVEPITTNAAIAMTTAMEASVISGSSELDMTSMITRKISPGIAANLLPFFLLFWFMRGRPLSV